MAWRFAARQDLSEGGESSLRRIDFENRDAIVAAIGSVKKFSGGVHSNFSGFLAAGIILGERGDVLQGFEGCGFFLVRKDRHGRINFVKDVRELAVRMKREMARAGTGFYFCKAGEQRRKDSFGRVEAIDNDLIEAQINGEREAIVRRRADPVGVRAFLALFVGAGAGMLNETGGGAERAVVVNRKRSDAAAIVIRYEGKGAILIQGNVARAGAARGDLIQELERAGFRVDGKRA